MAITVPNANAAAVSAVTSQTVNLTVSAKGDAIYLWVFESTSGTQVSSVSDGVNTYVRKVLATGSTNGGAASLWVADNVAGSNVTITVNFSASAIGSLVAQDLHGQATVSSFGGQGTAARSSSYTSGSNLGDAVTPANAAALLMLGFAVRVVGTAGIPTLTFNTVAGETLQASAAGASALAVHTRHGGGSYTKASTGLTAQTLNGNATFSGTGAAATAVALAVWVIPAAPGVESIAETASLIVSEKPSGAASVAETGAVVVSESPTGAGHVQERAAVVVSAAPKGTALVNETASLVVPVAPQGTGAVQETASVTASARINLTPLISEVATLRIGPAPPQPGGGGGGGYATMPAASQYAPTCWVTIDAELLPKWNLVVTVDPNCLPNPSVPDVSYGDESLTYVRPKPRTLEELGWVPLVKDEKGRERTPEEQQELVQRFIVYDPEGDLVAPGPPPWLVAAVALGAGVGLGLLFAWWFSRR